MKTQLEFLEETIRLKKANPDMEIHFCVDHDEFAENGAWTKHKINNVEICPWFEDGDMIYTDEDDVKDAMVDYFDTEDFIEKQYAKIKKAICVFTGAG